MIFDELINGRVGQAH